MSKSSLLYCNGVNKGRWTGGVPRVPPPVVYTEAELVDMGYRTLTPYDPVFPFTGRTTGIWPIYVSPDKALEKGDFVMHIGTQHRIDGVIDDGNGLLYRGTRITRTNKFNRGTGIRSGKNTIANVLLRHREIVAHGGYYLKRADGGRVNTLQVNEEEYRPAEDTGNIGAQSESGG